MAVVILSGRHPMFAEREAELRAKAQEAARSDRRRQWLGRTGDPPPEFVVSARDSAGRIIAIRNADSA